MTVSSTFSRGQLVAMALRRLAPGAAFQVVDGDVLWLAPDVDRPTDREIGEELLAVVARLDAPRPDWRGFLSDVRSLPVFARRGLLDASVAPLAAELRTLLGEAAIGIVDRDAIQGSLDDLVEHLSADQLTAIEKATAKRHVPLVIARAPASSSGERGQAR